MGWFRRECPCCGGLVPRWGFRAHILGHAPPPDDPGPSAPRRFRHDSATCGSETDLPEPVRRVYRDDPLEGLDVLICSGCREPVHVAFLSWCDTGESLLCDLSRRRARVPLVRRLGAFATSSLGGGAIGGALIWAYTGRGEGLALGLLIGAGFGLWLRPAIRQALRLSNETSSSLDEAEPDSPGENFENP